MVSDKTVLYICEPCLKRNDIYKIYDKMFYHDQTYYYYQPKRKFLILDCSSIHAAWIN